VLPNSVFALPNSIIARKKSFIALPNSFFARKKSVIEFPNLVIEFPNPVAARKIQRQRLQDKKFFVSGELLLLTLTGLTALSGLSGRALLQHQCNSGPVRLFISKK
jgi:hypothetical protein